MAAVVIIVSVIIIIPFIARGVVGGAAGAAVPGNVHSDGSVDVRGKPDAIEK